MRSTSAELIDVVLSLMPDAAVVVDRTGVITHANASLSVLFGYDDADLLGRPIEVLVPERLRSVHRARRTGFSEDPRPRAMGAGLALFGRRRDGTEFPVDISLAPLELAGEPSSVASIRDVSDRLANEAARAQLVAIVEGSGDAIFALGVDGFVQSWNPGAQRTLGYEARDVVGTHVSAIVPPSSAIDLEDQLGAAMRPEPRAACDMELLTKAGECLPVALVVSPLQTDGDEITGFSVVARDITERKRSEAELRRLLVAGERNALWQETTAEIRLRSLDGAELDEVIGLACERLEALIGAKGVAVVLTEPTRVVAASGLAAGLAGAADLSSLLQGSGVEVRAATSIDPAWAEEVGAAHTLVVPIGPPADHAGSLICVVEPDPDDATVTMTMSFAEQMALAIELDRAKAERDLLLIGDERGRIARDLHDLVIQRLFASGLSLQSLLPLVSDERAAARLIEVVDELDSTIREIRTTIFTLAPPAHSATGLRAEVLDLVEESSRLLGFRATTRFVGPVDSAVGPAEAQHILAVIREALANVARHARAHRARVEVSATVDRVEVVVQDDGIGVVERPRESGLRNLRQRAEDLGGELAVRPAEPNGTELRWRIPLAGRPPG